MKVASRFLLAGMLVAAFGTFGVVQAAPGDSAALVNTLMRHLITNGHFSKKPGRANSMEVERKSGPSVYGSSYVGGFGGLYLTPALYAAVDRFCSDRLGGTLFVNRRKGNIGTGRLRANVLAGLIREVYPSGLWIGDYAARSLYAPFRGFARQFALVAMHLDRNPRLWARIRKAQARAFADKKFYLLPSDVASSGGLFGKDALPGCPHHSDNSDCRTVNMQIALFLARRKADNSLPVVFRSLERVYRAYDEPWWFKSSRRVTSAFASLPLL